MRVVEPPLPYESLPLPVVNVNCFFGCGSGDWDDCDDCDDCDDSANGDSEPVKGLGKSISARDT